jgi:DnaJ like chaperone protein
MFSASSTLARQDIAGFEHYAGQIRTIVRRQSRHAGDILDGLFEIAKADGVLHPGEAAFLERVADIFGFAPAEFRRIRASHFAPELTDPYVILGLSYAADNDELKQTYRRLGAREPSRQLDGARRAAGIHQTGRDQWRL